VLVKRSFAAGLVLVFLFVCAGCGTGRTGDTNTGSGGSGGSGGGGTGGGTGNSAGLTSINHIIFMVQENRGFDHYFGQLPAYLQANGYPQTVDGEPANASNPAANGAGSVSAFHLQTQCLQSQSPFWNESHRDYNWHQPTSATAALDGFVTVAARDAAANGYADTAGKRVMGYYDSSDLPYYYFLAANFATSDRWFSPVMSRTQPNRYYLLAGTSAGKVYPLLPSQPRLTVPTIFDALQKAGISWKIYVGDLDFNPPTNDSQLTDFEAAAKYPKNFVPASQFATDANHGTLPQVAMIEPAWLAGLDEHAIVIANQPGTGIQLGVKYVSGFINSLMQSQSWKDSVFLLTWDEGGGYYDHVPPQPAVSPDGIAPSDLQPGDICFNAKGPTCDFTYTGYRVPLIVISPFTKKNYVSHTVADYSAILKLIETRFSIPSLTKRDAAQMDMTEFFDFKNIPWKTPPTPPDQPTDMPCYLDRLP
jgi:phospholipase C